MQGDLRVEERPRVEGARVMGEIRACWQNSCAACLCRDFGTRRQISASRRKMARECTVTSCEKMRAWWEIQRDEIRA